MHSKQNYAGHMSLPASHMTGRIVILSEIVR